MCPQSFYPFERPFARAQAALEAAVNLAAVETLAVGQFHSEPIDVGRHLCMYP